GNLTIVDATVAGTAAAPVDEGGLRDGGFELIELTDNTEEGGSGACVGRAGAISGIVLDFRQPDEDPARLPHGAPSDILALTVEAVIPPEGDALASLVFVDGCQGNGQPVSNNVSWNTVTNLPTLTAKDITLGVPPPEIPLVEGSPRAIILASTLQSQLFTLAADPGEAILLTLSDADAENANSLYVRWGAPATASEWDMAAAEPGQAEQRLLIPGDRDLTCTILVQADVIAGSSSQVTLLAERAPLALESIAPARSSRGSTVSVEIAGGGFDASTEFTLVDASAHEIPSSAAEVLSDREAQALFDLGGAPLGSYDLRARRLAADVHLAGAFEVVAAVLGPRLEASLEGVAECEYLLETPFALRYRNAGDSEMTAPLVKLSLARTACSGEGPTRLGLERRGEFWMEELLALAVERDGIAGKLGPGDVLELLPLWVLTELDPCPGGECSPCEVELRAQVFRPEGAGAIAWDELPAPAGVSAAGWAEIRPELRAILGETWAGYHESLAQLSTRLSRRGIDGASVLDLFRFAARQAYGRPSCAVAGTLARIDGTTGRRLPLAGRYVVAREEGEVKSSARTDSEGRFVIDWLEGGKLYEIAAADGTGARSAAVPASGDVFGLDIEVSSLGDGPEPGCPNRDESGLPLEPLMPPAEHFDADRIAPLALEVVRAFDPNEKIGPSGVLDTRVVSIYKPIRYLVTFENLGTGSVWKVTVADEIHPGLDPSTIEFDDVGLVSVEERLDRVLSASTYGSTQLLQMAEGQQLLALPSWDPAGSLARWQLQSVDIIEQTATTPRTHVPLEGSDGYFLPPHDPESPQVGRVSFSVLPRRDLPEDEEITNEASIYFNNDPAPVRTG
ncbi:MAG: hypothetical protein JXA90_04325, partial [Planctomycetes bacterium]|nr:hypothetical protein [Planctomycetota bacterium]